MTYATLFRGNIFSKNAVPDKNITLAKANPGPMKSVFSNNTIHYKKGSLSSGVGSVTNHRNRGKKT
jgi:hypothetical protein